MSAAGPGCWRGEVTDRWDVPAGPPNGGYVLAVAARAMAQAADQAPGPTAVLGAPPELPPVEECKAPPDAPGLFQRFDYRSPAEDVHFTSGPSGRGEVRTWLRFADGRRSDPVGLVVVSDASAPARQLALAPRAPQVSGA